ncbi:MAG: hypothetical protein M3R37_02940 [Actinomycetota bacterium]|nr:hypothetical protein [Actinomycetota bacterium]
MLERAAGLRLPGALLIPSGVAVMVVVAGFATIGAATAPFAVSAIVGLAVVGLACGVARERLRSAVFPVAVAVAVFCTYAAPVVLSGQATFAGYIKLDDTATFLALTDRVMQHGHSISGLAPSSYEATLSVNLGHGYPVGALLPFGVGRALVGVDGAWVYQPYLAFLAAMLGLVLYEIAGCVIHSRRLRAIAAVVAAQPALLYGFALWGGIKELAAAALVALAAALAPMLTEHPSSHRRLLPLATALAAVVGVLSVGGVVWFLGPGVIVAVIATRGRPMATRVAALSGFVLLLAVPSLVGARSFLSPATEVAVRSSTVLGNLVHPLSSLQVFGVWPTGDFRLAPPDLAATRILIGAVALAALVGIALAWRARASGLLLYVASAIASCALVASLGSPWIVAKGYAIASPALVLAAIVGCAGIFACGRVTEGIVGLVAVVSGVLWSNVLAYHDVNLAPRQQLVELERIGHRFAGEGPALMTEYQPYGVRHFLRALDAEGASELRHRPIPLRSGGVLGKGVYADLADFQESAVGIYRTLVLRRSPLASRPPLAYRLVWTGRFYDVWQRGSGSDAVRVLSGRACSVRSPAFVVGLGRVAHPSTWTAALGGSVLYPSGPGSVGAVIQRSTAGRFSVWVGGSFRNRLAAVIDGRPVGARTGQLNNAGQYTPLGTITLAAGAHVVELRYSKGVFAPGTGGPEYGLGPLVFSREPPACSSSLD